MLKRSCTSRIVVGAALAALVGYASPASAGCDAEGLPSPAGSNCWRLKGSDTLFEIMTQAITDARTLPTPLATELFYEGTGSGNGEAQMTKATATGLGVQSIAPMSRNFRPKFIDSLDTTGTGGADFVARTATNLTAVGHAAWKPSPDNVVALDAAVFLVDAAVPLTDLQFNTFFDNAAGNSVPKASKNNDTLPLSFGHASINEALNPTFNYSNIMSVILSGVDGTGTVKACADPRRLQALQDLSDAMAVSTLNHVYRRDDNSGTTDTFKDRIMVVDNTDTKNLNRYPFTGGRFCNGTALGNIDGSTQLQGTCSVSRATTCYSIKDCPGAATGEVCQFNLNNQDFDPIRRPCAAASATAAPTSCTNQVTGQACQANQAGNKFCSVTTGTACTADANCPATEKCLDFCTQGLVVALSDTDPGSSDITISIGNRVKDGQQQVIGYAGRAGTTVGTGDVVKPLFINGTSPASADGGDDYVRQETYLLARRLFIQSPYTKAGAAKAGSTAQDAIDDTQTNLGVTGGNTFQLAAEKAFFTGFLTNRARMDKISRDKGFIRCASLLNNTACSGLTEADCDGADPAGDLTPNLCVSPAVAVVGALGAYLPNKTTGTNDALGRGTGSAKTINSAGRQWTSAGLIQAPGSGLCVSGGTAAGTPAVCPDVLPRPVEAPCTQPSDCASGFCRNSHGHGSLGKGYGLYCTAQ
jgi:hypothetical protein